MGIKPQLSALALSIGLVTIALALLNTNKIGEGLIVSVVALMAVRYWARRSADAYLAKLYAARPHGLDKNWTPPAPRDRRTTPTAPDSGRNG